MGYPNHQWRPSAGTKTGRVWEIADELAARLGRVPRVSEVVAAYTAEGGHPSTGQVQFYAWRNTRPGAPPTAPARVDPPRPTGGAGWLDVTADGHLALPAALRDAIGLHGAGRLHARLADGEIRLSTASGWLAAAQDLARRLDPSDASWSDEVIAERRAEGPSE